MCFRQFPVRGKVFLVLPQTVDEFRALLKNTQYFPTVPINPFYHGSDPTLGWSYDPTTGAVFAVQGP
ncbi:MAG: hypothetical protein ACPLSA_00515 [Caldanaerobacter sp.]